MVLIITIIMIYICIKLNHILTFFSYFTSLNILFVCFLFVFNVCKPFRIMPSVADYLAHFLSYGTGVCHRELIHQNTLHIIPLRKSLKVA